ncbi:MAG: hypothetical protein L0Z48_07030 [candidate division Zixibacteria bacterium]|nr:hypothetical protein [candidate division Zixibacteria bacterium]
MKISIKSINLAFTLKGGTSNMPKSSYYLTSLSKDRTPVAWAITNGDIKTELKQILERKPKKAEIEIATKMIGEAISDWPVILSENLNWITDVKRREDLMRRYTQPQKAGRVQNGEIHKNKK